MEEGALSKGEMGTFELVKTLYKNDEGKPFELTTSQVELFDLVFKKKHKRCHIMTHTQYGKSLVVALAVLTRVSTFPEKWCIVAPSNKKAEIIMGYIIQHAFDNAYTMNKMEIGKESSMERLRRERSSKRLTFRIGKRIGEVFVLSAEARRTSDVEEALMGFGSPNIVEDESALIKDKIHSTAMRMLGGYHDNYLFKIGNPFRRNHFLRSFRDDKYYKLTVDWKKSVAEGRIKQDFVDEMRKEAFFDVLYDCQFPPEDYIDEKGWMPLLSEKDIQMAQEEGDHFGQERMGIDVAGTGSNNSVIVKRSAGYAEMLFKSDSIDLMDFAGKIMIESKNFNTDRRYIDNIGIGAGVYSRLREQGFRVVGANVALKAADSRFFNKRAEVYWRLREWIKSGGKLSKDKDWNQLLYIKYKADSSGKLQIIPKIELLREGKESPDAADALALTFYDPPRLKLLTEEEKRFYKRILSKKRSKKDRNPRRMTAY